MAAGKEKIDGRPPLAERMRPRNLEEFVGQEHLLGPGKFLRRLLESGKIFPLIFWGPPGSGKTTLAQMISHYTQARFVQFSAVLSGVKEIREVVREAEDLWGRENQKTILFVDEIHRFNKAQQDAFLPHVEKGTILLIGATTENPSFEVIAPLLSRAKVLVLKALSESDLEAILVRAFSDAERGLGDSSVSLIPEALDLIKQLADGDARIALNILEQAFYLAQSGPEPLAITRELVEEAFQKKALRYDKGGEEHYNLISALHKSLRGSDPDGSLYWLARMLESGEDPLYVARRLVRFAAEDVGLADPQALPQALAAKEAYHFLGSPEGELALVQAVIYLATAPKSNALYRAFAEVRKDIQKTQSLPVPFHLRNAPTALMKGMGYGRDYRYPHDFPDALVAQDYLPEALKGHRYYQPIGRGFEQQIKSRLDFWRRKLANNTDSVHRRKV
ncbi:MAG TPA: replication-associated recombination protein A [Thermodesulfobacteriota bacterium]|nr:replication-associated recombination protein A [Thermodesulfobacteriota bacterium]